MSVWEVRGRIIASNARPRVMGILNVTPDSFSDGGQFYDPESAIARGLGLIDEGADILDIGGESSRPGASPVSAEEEIRRVIPVIERLAAESSIPISVDTTKPEVARRALAAGATIVNDIGGLRDPAMLDVLAASDAGVVIMHMAGTPPTMQANPTYRDVVAEVREYLAAQIELAERRGISRKRVALDPGIGFGKTSEHNWNLLRHLGRFLDLGCVVLVGTSRKSLLGRLTGRSVDCRLAASVVSSIAAIHLGASVVRVHDVAAMIDAIRVWGRVFPGDLQQEVEVGP